MAGARGSCEGRVGSDGARVHNRQRHSAKVLVLSR